MFFCLGGGGGLGSRVRFQPGVCTELIQSLQFQRWFGPNLRTSCLNSLKRFLYVLAWGTTMEVTQGDTRSLGYGLYVT